MAVVAAATAGCGGAAQPAKPTLKTGVTLRWAATDTDPSRIESQKRQAAVYERQFPGNKVDIVLDGENLDKLKAMVAAGDPLDLASVRTTDYPSLAKQGALVALDERIKRDKFDMSKLFARIVPSWQWRDKLWAMPSSGVLGAFLNLKLQEEAGAKRPPNTWGDPSWDWNAWSELGQRITKRDGAQTSQWGFSGSYNNPRFYMAWVWSHGGDLFDKNLTKVTLGDNGAMEGLQLLADMIGKQRIAPNDEELAAAGGARKAFEGGKLGINVSATSAVVTNRLVPGLRWTIVPMPRGPKGAFVGGGGTGSSLMAGAKYVDETWELLKSLYSPEVEKLVIADGQLPRLKASANDPDFVNPKEAPGADMKVFVEALDKGLVTDTVLLQGTDIYKIVNDNLASAFNGKQSVRAAVDTIKARVEPMLPAERA
jgi:ABC-type glycerol-3-phosphate transport system substrate-binding protein